jgi:glucose uptake protein GlcU
MTDNIYKAPESNLEKDNKINQYRKNIKNDAVAIVLCFSFIYFMWFVFSYRNIFITFISVVLFFYMLMSLITLPINYFKFKKAIRNEADK